MFQDLIKPGYLSHFTEWETWCTIYLFPLSFSSDQISLKIQENHLCIVLDSYNRLPGLGKVPLQEKDSCIGFIPCYIFSLQIMGKKVHVMSDESYSQLRFFTTLRFDFPILIIWFILCLNRYMQLISSCNSIVLEKMDISCKSCLYCYIGVFAFARNVILFPIKWIIIKSFPYIINTCCH